MLNTSLNQQSLTPAQITNTFRHVGEFLFSLSKLLLYAGMLAVITTPLNISAEKPAPAQKRSKKQTLKSV